MSEEERMQLLKDKLIDHIKKENSDIELAIIYSSIARCYYCPLFTKCDKQSRHCLQTIFKYIKEGL